MNYSVSKKAVYFCGGRVCTLQQTASRRGLGWMDRKEGNRVRLCCELIPALRWRVGVSAGDKWLNVMRSRGEAFHALQNFRYYWTSGCLFQTSDITEKGFFVLKIKVFCRRRQPVLGPFGQAKGFNAPAMFMSHYFQMIWCHPGDRSLRYAWHKAWQICTVKPDDMNRWCSAAGQMSTDWLEALDVHLNWTKRNRSVPKAGYLVLFCALTFPNFSGIEVLWPKLIKSWTSCVKGTVTWTRPKRASWDELGMRMCWTQWCSTSVAFYVEILFKSLFCQAWNCIVKTMSKPLSSWG